MANESDDNTLTYAKVLDMYEKIKVASGLNPATTMWMKYSPAPSICNPLPGEHLLWSYRFKKTFYNPAVRQYETGRLFDMAGKGMTLAVGARYLSITEDLVETDIWFARVFAPHSTETDQVDEQREKDQCTDRQREV